MLWLATTMDWFQGVSQATLGFLVGTGILALVALAKRQLHRHRDGKPHRRWND